MAQLYFEEVPWRNFEPMTGGSKKNKLIIIFTFTKIHMPCLQEYGSISSGGVWKEVESPGQYEDDLVWSTDDHKEFPYQKIPVDSGCDSQGNPLPSWQEFGTTKGGDNTGWTFV